MECGLGGRRGFRKDEEVMRIGKEEMGRCVEVVVEVIKDYIG